MEGGGRRGAATGQSRPAPHAQTLATHCTCRQQLFAEDGEGEEDTRRQRAQTCELLAEAVALNGLQNSSATLPCPFPFPNTNTNHYPNQ